MALLDNTSVLYLWLGWLMQTYPVGKKKKKRLSSLKGCVKPRKGLNHASVVTALQSKESHRLLLAELFVGPTRFLSPST